MELFVRRADLSSLVTVSGEMSSNVIESSGTDGTTEATHADLPAYIELELEDAMSALRSYPHVWWHLLICRECAETYWLTRTLLEAEWSGQLAALPRPRQITFPNIVRLGREIL